MGVMFTILTCVSSCLVSTLQAAIIVTNVQMLAVQQVNLLGVSASLVASGPATFTFDVDGNMNTIPGGVSTIDTLFSGFLPVEFKPLGVYDAPFQLFSLNPEVLTVTNGGTHVRIDTTFGLRVFAGPGLVGAEFFTKIPSVFEANVTSLRVLNGSVFQASNRPNDITEIFIGNSILPGLPPAGSLVGISFDRTVTAVPEPTSILLWAMIGFACVPFARKRKKSSEPRPLNHDR